MNRNVAVASAVLSVILIAELLKKEKRDEKSNYTKTVADVAPYTI